MFLGLACGMSSLLTLRISSRVIQAMSLMRVKVHRMLRPTEQQGRMPSECVSSPFDRAEIKPHAPCCQQHPLVERRLLFAHHGQPAVEELDINPAGSLCACCQPIPQSRLLLQVSSTCRLAQALRRASLSASVHAIAWQSAPNTSNQQASSGCSSAFTA